MKFPKDLESPKEMVLNKRVVLELARRGGANKGNRAVMEQRETGETECQNNQNRQRLPQEGVVSCVRFF